MKAIKQFLINNWGFLVVVALMTIMLLCSSCKGTERIVVAHDTIYKNKIEYKERLVHDSTYIKDTMWMRGDTVWRDRYRYVLRERVDTMAVHDTSYVQVDMPYAVYKTKNVYLWWPSVLILIATSAGGCYWYAKRKKGGRIDADEI